MIGLLHELDLSHIVFHINYSDVPSEGVKESTTACHKISDAFLQKISTIQSTRKIMESDQNLPL